MLRVAAGYGCGPGGALPPEFVAVSGDVPVSLLLLHADVCVFVVVKFLCGVPDSVHVLVEAPCADGAATAPIASTTGTSILIRLDIRTSLMGRSSDNRLFGERPVHERSLRKTPKSS